METKTITKKRKLLPDLDMTHEEFMARVRKAEEGQEMIRQWREQRRNR